MFSGLSTRNLFIFLMAAGLVACVSTRGPKLGLVGGTTPKDLNRLKAEISRLEKTAAEPQNLLIYYHSAADLATTLGSHKEAIAFSGKGIQLIEIIENNRNQQGDIYRQYYKDLYKQIYGADEYAKAATQNLTTYKQAFTSVLYRAHSARGDENSARAHLEALNAQSQEMQRQALAAAKNQAGSGHYQKALKQQAAAMEESRKLQERSRKCGEKLNEAFGVFASAPDENSKSRVVKDFLASPCGRHYRETTAMRYGYSIGNATGGRGMKIDARAKELLPVWLFASFGQREEARAALRHNFPIRKQLNAKRIAETKKMYKAEFGISLGHLLVAAMQKSQSNQAVVSTLGRIFRDYAELLNTCMEYDETDLAGEVLVEINTLSSQYERLLDSYERSIRPYDTINMGALARTYAHLPDVELKHITRMLEKRITALETKRTHIPSQSDRIGLIKKSQTMLQSMVLREFRKGEYEKSLELALRSKSRTMVDLFLSSATVAVESGHSSGPKFTFTQADGSDGKRAISIEPAAQKAGGAFDLNLETAASLPGLPELCNNIPPGTAFLETLTTSDGLYLWLLTTEGVVDEKYIPISSYELGEKIWQIRTRLELGKQAAKQTGNLTLSFNLLTGEDIYSRHVVEIYLTNRTNRPVSPLYGTYRKTGMPTPATLKLTAPFIQPGKKEKIGTFDMLGNNYTINIGTDLGELKGGLTHAGENRLNWKSYATVKGKKYSGVPLSKLIFEPFEGPLSSVRRLVISPHGVLNYLPFDLLEVNGRYACERWAISTLPSTVMVALMHTQKSAPTGRALILGNPDTDIPGLGSLPGAELEARQIAKIISMPSKVAIGKYATETLIKQAAPEAGIIHIASHGIFLPSDPMQSFLAVAADNQNDGRLTVAEIFDLKLPQAPVVVLSACKTGLNNLHEGNELFGFMRAFLYNGTSHLITSLWDVDDDATRFLMTSFYRHLKAGTAPVTALQKAKIDAIKSGKYAAPVKWGAFIIVGV